MAAVAEATGVDAGPGPGPSRNGLSGSTWPSRALLLLTVAVAVSPIVIAAASIVGDTWYPVGDWAHVVFRVSQVGSRETPLVGAYTVKGWAHPGPLLFWLGAPLHRLTGGDPRSIEWTAAVVNVASLVALAAVAWRRGRWPLLLATMTLAALLVRGFTVVRMIDLWNPYIPLLPFALALFLVWDAALGRRRALLEALLPASLAMQSHLAFVTLVGLLAVWFVAWERWHRRVVDGDGDDRPDAGPWRPHLRRGTWIVALLWCGPLLDLVVDLHNPIRIAATFRHRDGRIGIVRAVDVVGRYVRPDGPWMGGTEERLVPLPDAGPGLLPALLAGVALVACLTVARRRRLVDVAALATLALVLLVGAVPATAQIPLPAEAYLTQWLKVVGGLVWFTVGWTLWRVAEPAVRDVPLRRRASAVLAGALLVAAATTTWAGATTTTLPFARLGPHVVAVAAELEPQLPRDRTIRIERRGERVHLFGSGLVYRLVTDGYDVVTEEGRLGLKWGHAHRWFDGEPYDVLLTFAVDEANDQCALDPEARALVLYDNLSAEERRWYDDVRLRRLAGPDAINPEQTRRADRLATQDVRLGVYEGPRPCAEDTFLDAPSP